MIGKLSKKDSFAIIYVTVLTVFALVWGFSIVPFPGTQKEFDNDHKRVIDISQIKDTIDDYSQNNNHLPATLNDLTYNVDDNAHPLAKTDPQTRKPYTYGLTSQTTYQLCATFQTDSTNDNPNAYDDTSGDYTNNQSDYTHPAGYHCFDETSNATDVQDGSDPTCTGDCPSDQVSPTPLPYPSRLPCRAGVMCPMQNNDSLPTIYQPGPTTVPVGSGGPGQFQAQ